MSSVLKLAHVNY